MLYFREITKLKYPPEQHKSAPCPVIAVYAVPTHPDNVPCMFSGCAIPNVTENLCGEARCTPGEFGYTCGERTKTPKTLDVAIQVDRLLANCARVWQTCTVHTVACYYCSLSPPTLKNSPHLLRRIHFSTISQGPLWCLSTPHPTCHERVTITF